MSDLAFQMQESIKSLGEFLLKSWHYVIFFVRQNGINGVSPVAYQYCKYNSVSMWISHSIFVSIE